MTIKTDHILNALMVLSWIVFVGLCIEAGGFLTNFIGTLWLGVEGAAHLWKQVNLDPVYRFGSGEYVTLASLIVIVAVLKALLFFAIIKAFYNRNLSLSRPFHRSTERFVFSLGYLSLGIGLFSSWGAKVSDALLSKGVTVPDLRAMRLAGGDVWLFMGIVLLVVAVMFRKGVELQNENDLTV